MADRGGWPRRRDWYTSWSRASNADRLKMTWREHRGLVVVIGLLAAVAGAWLFWDHVTAFGAWLDTYAETIRNLALAVGVVAAIFGGWVAYRRSQTDRIRAETDRRRQVTESFEGAVTLLGHEDRSVRLGAIYALERIARQNRDEHWPIMETLTAYVREWSQRVNWGATIDMIGDDGPEAKNPIPAHADLQAAFNVLGRRKLKYEQGSVPRILNLDGAYLAYSNPDLPRMFRDAVLRGVNLFRANLSRARLERADLSDANLQRARLVVAHLEMANLELADLRWAWLQGAKLTDGTNLTQVELRGANLHGADLSGAVGLVQEQLDSASGDADTKIPERLSRPEHWSK